MTTDQNLMLCAKLSGFRLSSSQTASVATAVSRESFMFA